VRTYVITRDTSSLEIPIAYLRGRRRLYGHDFVNVRNQLVYDSDFISNVTGILLVSPGSESAIKAPGIEVTGEFKRDAEGGLIPLWYGYSMSRTAVATAVKRKAVTKVVEAGPGRIARVEGLIEREGQYIASNTVRVEVAGQVQSRTSYYIEHADGTIVGDMSSLPVGNVSISVSYELVDPGVQVKISDGISSVRLNKHFENQYSILVLTSRNTTGTVTFLSGDETVEETLLPSLLYKLISPEFVTEGTYTYGFDENDLRLPSDKASQVFAIRSSRPDISTTMFVLPPEGTPVDAPWFLRVGGISTEPYEIKELGSRVEEIIFRRERTEPLGTNKIAISARKIRLGVTSEGEIDGLDVYPEGYPDKKLPVTAFNGETGLITLGIELVPGSKVIIEYKEVADWFEYRNLQINPSLSEDPEELEDYILLYMDPDISDIESIKHIFLPKIIEGRIKTYTPEEISAKVIEVASNGKPLALIELVEPVDEDYYEIHDTRISGGYTVDTNTITNIALWAGEDIDISGVMIGNIPSKVVTDLTTKIQEWENIEDEFEAKKIAKQRIEDSIERYKRIGMKVFMEYKD